MANEKTLGMKTHALKLLCICLLNAAIIFHAFLAVSQEAILPIIEFHERLLEVHVSDTDNRMVWGPANDATGAISITDGHYNTQKIYIKYMHNDFDLYAARYCVELDAHGYSDWILPSRDELLHVFRQRHIIDDLLPAYYWSSTDDTWGAQAQAVDFRGGYSIHLNKTMHAHVICVRDAGDINSLPPPQLLRQYNPLNIISNYLDEMILTDPRMGRIDMYHVSGLTNEARRFYNNSGVNSLRHYETRKNTYISVLREIALQSEFDASNITGLYDLAENIQIFTDDEAIEFFASFALSLSDFSIKLLEEVAQNADLRYIRNVDNYSRQINKWKTFGRHIRHGSLKNFGTAMAAFSIITNSLNLAENAVAIATTASMLEAAKIDMGLLRLRHLQSSDIMNDRAFNDALLFVIEELESFNPTYWHALAYAIRDNQYRLINGTTSLANIATGVAAIANYNKFLPWIGAILFTVDTGFFIAVWRDTFKEAACAATIYKYMLKRDLAFYQPLDEDIMDYAQYLFVAKMENVLSNNYMRFWELINAQRREIRVFFSDEHEYAVMAIKNKRINRFVEILFDEAESGSIRGVVVDAITENPLGGVIVYVYKDGGLLLQHATDEDGTYAFGLPAASDYQLEFQKTGYISAIYREVEVVTDEINYLEAVMQIDESYAGFGAISGKVVNAFNGQSIPNVKLIVRHGINTTDGPVIATGYSDNNGKYLFFDIQAGNYSIEAVKDSFVGASISVSCIGGQTRANQEIFLTPEINDQEIRIILDWGRNPADLDSHLSGPVPGSSERFHVFFRNKQFNHNNSTHAALDHDVTSSYGPETITVYIQGTGTYRYGVHDYTNRNASNSRALSSSNARVRVFRGPYLTNTFHVPPNSTGIFWTVFELNGNQIIPINRMSNSLDP